MDSLRKNLVWGFCIALAFSVTPYVYAEAPICPSKKEIYRVCENHPSKNASIRLDFFNAPFEREGDRCMIYNHAVEMKDWQYPPLEEFVGLALGGLMEGMEVEPLFDILGKFPTPPLAKATSSEVVKPNCHRATEAESKQLTLRLGDLNYKDIPLPLLKELETYCLAFKVGVETWKRMMVSVTEAFVIPLGNINLVVMGRNEEPVLEGDSFSSETSFTESRVIYRTVGTCPVAGDPVECVEELLEDKWKDFRFAFEGGYTTHLKAIPFRARSDAYKNAWGGRFNGMTHVNVKFTDDGRANFTVAPFKGRNSKIFLSVREGTFAFETGESICDPETRGSRLVYLRPLAYSAAMALMLNETGIYTADDFPVPKRNIVNGSELGCATGSNYSEWATDTANTGKHYLWLGLDTKTLYDWVVSERRLWDLKGVGVPRSKNELVYGAARRAREETVLRDKDPLEEQARAFVGEASPRPNGVAARTVQIEETPTAEVWYYPKSVVGYRVKGKDVRSHVLIKHLPVPQAVFQTEFLDRVERIRTSCGDPRELKDEMANAMYIFFNIAPLQQGDEIVGKVFFSALYAKVFDQKLSAIRNFTNVDIDALTMTRADFVAKYSYLLN